MIRSHVELCHLMPRGRKIQSDSIIHRLLACTCLALLFTRPFVCFSLLAATGLKFSCIKSNSRSHDDKDHGSDRRPLQIRMEHDTILIAFPSAWTPTTVLYCSRRGQVYGQRSQTPTPEYSNTRHADPAVAGSLYIVRFWDSLNESEV